MRRLLPFVFAVTTLSLPAAELIRDPFTDAKFEGRRAERGPWVIENGTGNCAQDDALYAKFQNHGPVLWYDTAFTDAVIEFQFKPDANCKSFVFTLNGKDGHVFRFVTSTRGTGIRAWPQESPDHQSIALGKTGPALQAGVWTSVKITLSGGKAEVRIGDGFTESVEHASYGRAKTTLGLGFSFGTLAVKGLVVTTP